MHSLLADLYLGNIAQADMPMKFLTGFRSCVCNAAPSRDIYMKYFSQCNEAVRSPFVPNGDVIDVERRFEFDVLGHPFTGVADLIFRDEEHGLCIMDHKSRDLKKFSGRRKPTKSDQLLERYFRQLYLYAAALQQTFGLLPDSLAFNCFRTGLQIFQKFDTEAFEATKSWATNLIRTIVAEAYWLPDCDFFKCKYICSLHRSCAYYQS